MIKAHIFRIVPFKERLTESASENKFVFEMGETHDDHGKVKTVDEKHLAVAKDWWMHGL